MSRNLETLTVETVLKQWPFVAQQLEQNGLGEDFVQAENALAARTADGGICRNPDGSICLECTCGLVISGKTDSESPLCTPRGSFC